MAVSKHAHASSETETPSRVAQSLMKEEQSNPLHARLAGCVDSMLRAQCVASERHRLQPQQVVSGLDPLTRAMALTWAITVFDSWSIDRQIIHSVMLIVDRFCAMHKGGISANELKPIFLAAVSTAVKTEGGAEHLPLNAMLAQMCQDDLPLADIFRQEAAVLSKLDYVVCLPTPRTFLQSFGIPLQDQKQGAQWLSFAECILDVALLNPFIQYGLPHACVAAGALAASLKIFQAPLQQREELFKDVAACCPTFGETPCEELIALCEKELLLLWSSCFLGVGEFAPFFPTIAGKFNGRSILCSCTQVQKAYRAIVR
eukprot:TRINITY_DN17247_c0_g1_i3.p1 TRINITY_DN17247_c0_g1~~TRINITY_DN17247_c0_g1_i3.p1  ORF type:complete len:337 (-),score=61.61 TRINITY_DN17247_c0_g1_i3:15-962(-)